jgi:hypothetical protein
MDQESPHSSAVTPHRAARGVFPFFGFASRCSQVAGWIGGGPRTGMHDGADRSGEFGGLTDPPYISSLWDVQGHDLGRPSHFASKHENRVLLVGDGALPRVVPLQVRECEHGDGPVLVIGSRRRGDFSASQEFGLFRVLSG